MFENIKKLFKATWFRLTLLGIASVLVAWWLVNNPNVAAALGVVIQILLKELGWPFVVLASLLIFRRPLSEFLVSLGNNLGRIRKLSVGDNFSFSSDELITALVDREILKVGIQVAMAYDGMDKNEQDYLRDRSWTMKNHVQALGDSEKLQVIEEAINVALMDNKIQGPEYVVIRDIADLY
jgi:hypothetical protein